nr:hypothetical protein [Tanacetum cinerariifolium]
DDDRQALLQFEHGLIDEANQLASWVGKESDCCRWAGIGCDNSTGHVHRIHLPAVQITKLGVTISQVITTFLSSTTSAWTTDESDAPPTWKQPYCWCYSRINSKTIFTVKDLELLEMVNTSITSSMPEPFWRSFSNLQYLDMSQNQIHGELFHIPASLQALVLRSNKFNGLLPHISNGSSAMILDLLGQNPIRVLVRKILNSAPKKFLPIVATIEQYQHLDEMSFEEAIGRLTAYEERIKSQDTLEANDQDKLLMASLNNKTYGKWRDNHLSGLIPECWMKWLSLTFLNLQNNNFFGSNSKTLGSLSALGSLNMCGNKLSGRLPVYVKNLKNLQILQLARNELDGSIPAWIGRELSSLRILNLQSNNFEGNITDELCHLTFIQILNLSHNKLSGNIPRCFSSFSVLSKKVH